MLMNKFLARTTLLLGMVVSSTALAAERTVTLAVQNMYCAACPHTVKASLQAVPGVKTVTVSYKDKTAIVTYDDSTADVNALTAATTTRAIRRYRRAESTQTGQRHFKEDHDPRIHYHLPALQNG